MKTSLSEINQLRRDLKVQEQRLRSKESDLAQEKRSVAASSKHVNRVSTVAQRKHSLLALKEQALREAQVQLSKRVTGLAQVRQVRGCDKVC